MDSLFLLCFTESQNGWDCKGPLEVIFSDPPISTANHSKLHMTMSMHLLKISPEWDLHNLFGSLCQCSVNCTKKTNVFWYSGRTSCAPVCAHCFLFCTASSCSFFFSYWTVFILTHHKVFHTIFGSGTAKEEWRGGNVDIWQIAKVNQPITLGNSFLRRQLTSRLFKVCQKYELSGLTFFHYRHKDTRPTSKQNKTKTKLVSYKPVDIRNKI